MSQEQEKFLNLILENRKIIYKICHAYCRDPEDKKDLEQEIILQLWHSADKYNEQYKLSTWIYRIALNVAISFLRRENSRKKRISPIDQEMIERVANECEPQGLENNLERLYYFIYQLDELNRALMLLYLDAPPIRRSAKSSASARAMSPPRSAVLNNSSNRPLKLNRINKRSHHMNMELQELKDLWRQHDEKLDKQIQLNTQLLKLILEIIVTIRAK